MFLVFIKKLNQLILFVGTWAGHSGISTNGFWDTVYSPPVNNDPIPRTQSGYLWGSSPVWQPWAPEVPKTPTRTPPGFTPHREIEEVGGLLLIFVFWGVYSKTIELG